MLPKADPRRVGNGRSYCKGCQSQADSALALVMRETKVLAELLPIRVEFLRIAAERELPTLDALNELSPTGRLRLGLRRRRRASQGGFHRPGDELILVGESPYPLGDLVGEGDNH